MKWPGPSEPMAVVYVLVWEFVQNVYADLEEAQSQYPGTWTEIPNGFRVAEEWRLGEATIYRFGVIVKQ